MYITKAAPVMSKLNKIAWNNNNLRENTKLCFTMHVPSAHSSIGLKPEHIHMDREETEELSACLP